MILFYDGRKSRGPTDARPARGKSGRTALIATIVVGLHALLLINFARTQHPPSTIGDGSSKSVAMTVALVPASRLEDPRSQGADAKTQEFIAEQSQSSQPDSATEAQGAGDQPALDPGGSHADVQAQAAAVTHEGGGGGSRDDPWAHASLKSSLDNVGIYDLAARNSALFLSRVLPCLNGDSVVLTGVTVNVRLNSDGTVAAAEPARAGSAAGLPPTKSEALAIAAVHACAPYRDLVLGRTPVLKLPPVGRGA